MAKTSALQQLNAKIEACDRCPRLIEHCAKVAHDKRAAYRDWDYHGGPVPNFLAAKRPSKVRLLVVGLAPGAHGANRTGRMFTGDRSGDFLFRAMHAAGFTNQPEGTHRGDGLELIDAAISAAAHCAPPANKPTTDELANCQPWLVETFARLPHVRVVVCLGKLGFDATLKLYARRGWITKRSPYKFAHGAEYTFEGDATGAASNAADVPTLLCSYHPSQQNTFTGRLTDAMLADVFHRAAAIIQGT